MSLFAARQINCSFPPNYVKRRSVAHMSARSNSHPTHLCQHAIHLETITKQKKHHRQHDLNLIHKWRMNKSHACNCTVQYSFNNLNIYFFKFKSYKMLYLYVLNIMRNIEVKYMVCYMRNSYTKFAKMAALTHLRFLY